MYNIYTEHYQPKTPLTFDELKQTHPRVVWTRGRETVKGNRIYFGDDCRYQLDNCRPDSDYPYGGEVYWLVIEAVVSPEGFVLDIQEGSDGYSY